MSSAGVGGDELSAGEGEESAFWSQLSSVGCQIDSGERGVREKAGITVERRGKRENGQRSPTWNGRGYGAGGSFPAGDQGEWDPGGQRGVTPRGKGKDVKGADDRRAFGKENALVRAEREKRRAEGVCCC